MPKEKNYNPVQAQRKAEKARAIKKGKAEVQDRRNEKLARRNPERIQKQIDDIKAITTNGGKLSSRDEEMLGGLEKELKAVKKARDTLGDKAPTFGRGWTRDGDSRGGPGVLGKRRRNSNASTTDEDIPDDVKRIPMPRDTPPPISKEIMDQWYAKRRAKRDAEIASRQADKDVNNTPLGGKQRVETPVVESKTVYEAKPVTRDLRKEAVSAFVPSSVKMKMDKGQGQAGLLEPEEADRLEREGYMKSAKGDSDLASTDKGADVADSRPSHLRTVTVEEVDDDDG